MTRKSHRMRVPRSDAAQCRAIEGTSPGPSPTPRKISRSIAALSAAVFCCACTISNTSPGFNGADAPFPDCMRNLLFHPAGVYKLLLGTWQGAQSVSLQGFLGAMARGDCSHPAFKYGFRRLGLSTE